MRVLKKLGKYELIELIGHGAMGEVYKAHDPLIDRLVALKTITGSLVGNAELLGRFYQEARSAGALQHPNIVTVYELGQEGDTPFIAMEFLEGESLDKIIERRPVLPISQKVGIIVQVCRALDCAHRHGVVHRDVKPGNVMLTRDGTVKVVDFGIARLIDTSKTQANILIGTLGYMSPEQFQGERADQRTDIWGVGVLFFELLSYKRPFDGENASSLILNIVDEKKQPPRMREFMPECPSDLEALIDKMLKKDSGQRFQTMEELLFEIEPLWRNLQEESVSGLIADSEVLIEAEEFARARELLRKALQIDRRNDRANVLLEQVTANIKRIQLRSQVQNAITRGQDFLKDGRFKDAKAEAESAVKLDSSFAPAVEFLAEVNREAERVRQVQESLQLARQRLAEGALTEAAEEIRKVLSLDAANAAAHTLEKQIQDQQARRLERKRHAEILQRARKCWGDQQLDQCIQQLTEALKEFPNDAEIIKLLETARQDKTEQQRQQKLAEAKSLLATRKFDQALAMVQSLSAEHPEDPAVRKLHELVLQEKAELLQQQKLQDHVSNLHSLVNAGKFSEAVSRGEKLLREFPKETEIAELVNFARAELAQREQKRSLEDATENVRGRIQAGKFAEAILAAEAALARFPRNSDLEGLLGTARERLKEEKNREQLQKRIVEIRRRINGGQLTDAVDLARQTIASNGPDPQLTQMLSAAEMELAQKQERKDEQHRQVAEAENLVKEGRFAAATQILLGGIETHVLSKKDPRVRELLSEIQEKAPGALLTDSPPGSTPAGGPAANDSPAKDYVFLQHGNFTRTPPGQENISATERATEPPSNSTAIVPIVRGDSPLAIHEPAASLPSAEAGVLAGQTVLPLENKRREKFQATTVSLARLLKTRGATLGLSALALLLVIATVSYLFSQRSTNEGARLSEAQQLEQQKKWPEALAAYQKLAGGNDAIAKESAEQAARLKPLLERESSLLSAAQYAEARGNNSEAEGLYQQIADLHGDIEQAALLSVKKLHAPENPSVNPPVTGRPPFALKKGPDATPGAATVSPRGGENPGCVLFNTSDIAKQLGRADNDRARARYADAEREYSEVLACEPKNERALAGLSKTRAAKGLNGPN